MLCAKTQYPIWLCTFFSSLAGEDQDIKAVNYHMTITACKVGRVRHRAYCSREHGGRE